MRRELAQAPFQICGTYATGGWQFIMLDSYDPGHVGGRLSAAGARTARRDALADSRAHAMVCLHHHPIDMDSRWLDTHRSRQCRTISGASSMRTLTSAPIAWGHVHQAYEGERGGVRLFATPSTGAQFLPKSERYAVDSRPPAYRRFRLHADGSIDSEVRWVDSLRLRQAARALSTCRRDPRKAADPWRPRRVGLLGMACWRCALRPAAPTPRCIRCGSCTASTTPSICSAPSMCCARATIRSLPRCSMRTATRVRCSWKSTSRKSMARKCKRKCSPVRCCPTARPCRRSWGRRATRARRLWRARSASSLSMFDQFGPWFAAEAISQLQLAQLGFDASSGVEMYFIERADPAARGRARRAGPRAEFLEASTTEARAFLASLKDPGDRMNGRASEIAALPARPPAAGHALHRHHRPDRLAFGGVGSRVTPRRAAGPSDSPTSPRPSQPRAVSPPTRSKATIAEGGYSVTLLDGVSGSGKTELFRGRGRRDPPPAA